VANPFESPQRSEKNQQLDFEFRWKPADGKPQPQAPANPYIPPRDVVPDPRFQSPGGSVVPDWLKKPWNVPRGGAGQQPNWNLPPGDQQPTWRQTIPDFQFRQPADTIAPTLYSGVAANRKDQTQYKPGDKAYQIYDQAKDSVVRIQLHTRDSLGREVGTELGSGFFISKEGKLATAYHVVSSGNKDITVDLADGRTLKAHVLDVKPLSDIAVLQVDGRPGEQFKPLELAETSRGLQSGTPVFVVGHPRGWPETFVSEGTISGRQRMQDTDLEQDPSNPNRMMVATRLHIEKGNSGSPMLDANGKVIGVVSFGDEAYRGYADSVEDLNSMLGKSKSSDYFPNDLNVGHTVVRDGVITSLAGLSAITPRLSSNARVLGLSRGMAAWSGAITAYSDLNNYDWHAFKSSWNNGSTAEKFNSTVNFGADLSMLAGSAALMFGGAKLRTAASIMLGSGSVTKMLNGLGSDRAY
jgi:S1-C subfamily serine protease